MQKLIALVAVAALGAGAYFHYHSWHDQSNQIKAHIEELASGKNERFRLTYDKVETSGYPFRHEVKLQNPCFYFLATEPTLSVTDGCLKGEMFVSYDPYSTKRSLMVETDGDFVVTLPPEEGQDPKPVLVRGKVKQEYRFEDGYEFSRSNDVLYFLENLQTATLTAKNVNVLSVEDHSKEFAKDLSATIDYARKQRDAQTQKIDLTVDFQTELGDSAQSYPEPFNRFFANMTDVLTQFNKNSGVNSGHYDITMTLPSWAVAKALWHKADTFNIDEIPSFEVRASYKGKNNYYTSSSKLNADWEHAEDNSAKFSTNFSGAQDITKEGEKQLTTLLHEIVHDAVKMIIAEQRQNPNDVQVSLSPEQLEDLFQGMPTHMDMEMNLTFDKTVDSSHKEKYAVNVDPILINTDKGGVTVDLDYKSNEPFNGTIQVDSWVRIIDAVITRYNMIARMIEQGKSLPHVTEKERDHLIAILQKYSDTPSETPKNVSFSITENSDGNMIIGKQQDIRALVGELAFFFQHLSQKVHSK